MNFMPWKSKRSDLSRADDERSPMTRFRSEMDRLFEDYFLTPWKGMEKAWGLKRSWWPSVDVVDGDRDITIRAEIPGMEPEDVDIRISGNVLTLSGEKKEDKEERGKEGYYRSERHYGSFHRTVTLPAGCDPNQVEAEYDKGVLTIRVAKTESAKPKRIPVTGKK
jgi:HSP20 family protein